MLRLQTPPLIKTPQKSQTYQPFRHLSLNDEMDAHSSSNSSRWMLPYADLLTLLLGLFLVFIAAATHPNKTEAQSISHPNLPKEALLNPKENTAQEASALDTSIANQLKSQLKTVLPIQGIEIHPQARGLVISLKDTILFAPGQAELSSQAQQTLDSLLDRLNTVLNQTNSKKNGSLTSSQALNLNRTLSIEGHTDDTPINTNLYPSNWELSTARATRIVRYLVEHRHISPNRLAAVGYGEFRPVGNNSSIEGKQKNRRVDIVVLRD